MSLLGKRAAYGMCCDALFDWPWAPTCAPTAQAQLRIELGNLGPYALHREEDYQVYASRPSSRGSSTPAVLIERASDGHYRVSYADGAAFVIDHTASMVYGTSGGDLTLDDLVVYLQGPIFGFVLRLRGITCLHASAAVSGGRAFAVVGSGGMGKSTSAAVFARLGLPVLTDDVLALDDRGDRFAVQPGLPRVMLWPESVAALWGNAKALPRVVDGWEKRYLDLNLPGYHFASGPVQLDAIYVLSERVEAPAPTEISELAGAEALMRLVGNTYSNDFLDTAMRARELEVLGRLVGSVHMRRVRAQNDRSAIAGVCAAILADFKALAEH